MQLVDTHCHIHESDKLLKTGDDETRKRWAKLGYPSATKLIADAVEAGVWRMICVGCSMADSKRAVELAAKHPELWASIGIHPHEAQPHVDNPQWLIDFTALASRPGVVAVGECGLDYYYTHSSKEAQQRILRFQIELALKYDLPMIFHVRDAFDDFWSVFDEYEGIRGVVHSFSATEKELTQILARGLYVGLNGIMTFTKSQAQLAAAKAVPLNRLLLETDAPFLTPAPYRGTICEPKHVRVTAEFLAELRGESLAEIATTTTQNAQMLFDFKEVV
jgi:TatD DNase family protein